MPRRQSRYTIDRLPPISDHIHSESHESVLGTWTMRVCRPPALAHVVEAIWEVAGTVANTSERIFPNGTIDLVTNLGPAQRLLRPDLTDVFASGDTWLSGMQRQPLEMQSQSEVHVFGVRLRAGAAAAVLSAPMSVASGRTVRLRDISRDAAAVFGRGVDPARFAERAGAVCAWIEERCGTDPRCTNRVEWIVRQLEQHAGAVQIDGLRRAAGLSRKTIAGEFRAHVGATPKLLARILRFRCARVLLQQHPTSYAAIAAACGYFDQSHMVREFHEFGSMTPGEFIASTYPDGLSAVS